MKSRAGDVLYIVMPAYNEGENIERVVTSWIDKLKYGTKESRLVVADSGSKDDTHKILLKLQKKFSQLDILKTTSQYHGPKVTALYKYAIKNGADFVFQTDSDGQTDPDEFEGFWKKRHDYSGVLGNRKNRGDGKGRTFVEKVVCFLLRVFFGVRVKDANAPFRLMRGELLKKYLGKIPDSYDLPNIMLTAYFVHFKENITFREIKFAQRAAGKNSINFGKIFRIGFTSLRDFWRFRKDMYRGDNDLKKKIVVMGVFALIAGILIMISPEFPWNGGMEMTDSSVFLTVGRQMKAGEMPYLDTFDHKGPLLYIINFFGVLINETKGIFVFEFLAILMTLWFMFKIFRLKNDNVWLSLIMTLVLFTPFVNLYFSEGGNLTEQYAMPFITFSLYVFLRYFLEGRVSSLKTFFVGVGLASVLMMRANMAGVWVVFGVMILAKCLVKKEFKELWRYIKWLAIGMMCVIVPMVIWLIVNGAFDAFVDVYIRFNLAYTNTAEDDMLPAILRFTMDDVMVVLSLCLTGILVVTQKRSRFLMVTYALSYGFCILVACMGGRLYPHYGMVLVPYVVFPFAIFCNKLGKGENGRVLIEFAVLFLISLTFTSWKEVASREIDAINKELKNGELIGATSKICEYVDEYTDTNDRISVYGNWNFVYLRCNRLPVSRYSYQFLLYKVRPTTMDEYLEDIEKNKPKVFVIQGLYDGENIREFLKERDYTEKWRDEKTGARVYILNGV